MCEKYDSLHWKNAQPPTEVFCMFVIYQYLFLLWLIPSTHKEFEIAYKNIYQFIIYIYKMWIKEKTIKYTIG